MRLINTTTLDLQSFDDDSYIPKYAILSHTWGPAGEEVSFQEMTRRPILEDIYAKPGYIKIGKTCEIAREIYNLEYAWVDTCCIDKTSSAELSEAINSMFRWYRDAEICFAFLSDMTSDFRTFADSRWFTRGWTLQELIAPDNLVFFDQTWTERGSKLSLCELIHAITAIDRYVLSSSIENLDEYPVAVRMSWAASRKTTRSEDLAYCLLGIFDINMPMLYGEGTKAFLRLQEEIIKQTPDWSIFAWRSQRPQPGQEFMGLLATSVEHFRDSGGLVEIRDVSAGPQFSITNRGIRLEVNLGFQGTTGLYVLPLLHCFSWEPGTTIVGVSLRRIGTDVYLRETPYTLTTMSYSPIQRVIHVPKVLSEVQKRRMVHTVILVDDPFEHIHRDTQLQEVHPPGCWNPTGRIIYAGYTKGFLGYLVFNPPWSDQYDHFVAICCLGRLGWRVLLVAGRDWERIKEDFENHYFEHKRKLSDAGFCLGQHIELLPKDNRPQRWVVKLNMDADSLSCDRLVLKFRMYSRIWTV